jgi:hypothetical protein
VKIFALKEKINRAVTVLNLPYVCSWATNYYVFLSLTNRKSSVHLHALYSPRITPRTYIPLRGPLVISGQYCTMNNLLSELEQNTGLLDFPVGSYLPH